MRAVWFGKFATLVFGIKAKLVMALVLLVFDDPPAVGQQIGNKCLLLPCRDRNARPIPTADADDLPAHGCALWRE